MSEIDLKELRKLTPPGEVQINGEWFDYGGLWDDLISRLESAEAELSRLRAVVGEDDSGQWTTPVTDHRREDDE